MLRKDCMATLPVSRVQHTRPARCCSFACWFIIGLLKRQFDSRGIIRTPLPNFDSKIAISLPCIPSRDMRHSMVEIAWGIGVQGEADGAKIKSPQCVA